MKKDILKIVLFLALSCPLFLKADSLYYVASFRSYMSLDSLKNNVVMRTSKYVYGKASFYAGKFIGRKTANGEIFTSKHLTCAHPTYKFGTKLLVTNAKNGKSVQVRVNDRGNFTKYGRHIDLSKEAFTRIAHESTGVIKVKIEKL